MDFSLKVLSPSNNTGRRRRRYSSIIQERNTQGIVLMVQVTIIPWSHFRLTKNGQKKMMKLQFIIYHIPYWQKTEEGCFFEKLPLYWQSFGRQKCDQGIIVTWTLLGPLLPEPKYVKSSQMYLKINMIYHYLTSL